MMIVADEAMPDPDPQRSRGQALPRIAIGATVSDDGAARSEEMPDPFGADPSGTGAPAGNASTRATDQIVTAAPRPTESGLPANVHVSGTSTCVTSPDGSPTTADVAPS
jgi:hypothetical protein